MFSCIYQEIEVSNKNIPQKMESNVLKNIRMLILDDRNTYQKTCISDPQLDADFCKAAFT